MNEYKPYSAGNQRFESQDEAVAYAQRHNLCEVGFEFDDGRKWSGPPLKINQARLESQTPPSFDLFAWLRNRGQR